jgi:cell division protein FtsW
MILAKRLPCRFYSKLVYPFLLISFILLALQLVPKPGPKQVIIPQWLSWFWLSFQPSEVVVFSMVLYMAHSMSKKGQEMASFSKGLLPYVLVATAMISLILLRPEPNFCLWGRDGIQGPDYGTVVIIGLLVMILLIVGGVNRLHLFSVLMLASVSFILWLWLICPSYKLQRLLYFLNPWDKHKGTYYYGAIDLSTLFPSTVFGVGLGNGKNKLWYLSNPHTDSVLCVVSEELGLLGVFSIILLFGVLITRGIQVALNADDCYTRYLAVGLTSFIGLQVLVHAGVCMALLLQTSAVNLPLISYGGLSLVFTLLSVGILLNISSRRRRRFS